MSPDAYTPPLAHVEGRLTREAFLARTALAAGAAYGIGAVAPLVREALAKNQDRQEAVGDLNVLNFALTLALVAQSLFNQARDRARLGGRDRAIVDEIARDENAHVSRLRATISGLRGAPAASPEPDFGNAAGRRGSFLAVAETVENASVFALNTLVPQTSSKEVRLQLAAIAQVDARHSALISLIRGGNPAPKAFEDTLTVPQARERLAPYVPIFR